MANTLIAVRPARELLFLGLAVAALAAPVAAAVPLLVLAIVGWWRLSPPRRERWVLGIGVGVAALALLCSAVLVRRRASVEAWERDATEQYRQLVGELRQAASRAAGTVRTPVVSAAERSAAFAQLGELAARSAGEETYLLVDPDGQAVAWDGPGLLHEPRAAELPRRGFVFWTGFGSVTLAAVESTDDSRRPWRVLVGHSFSGDRLPFSGSAAVSARWSLLAEDEVAPAAAVLLAAAPAPRLAVLGPVVAAPPGPWGAAPRRIAAAFLAAALLTTAMMRGIGVALLLRTAVRAPVPPGVGAPTVLGALAGGVACELDAFALLILGAGVALASLPCRRHAVGGGAIGALGSLLLPLTAWGIELRFGPLDLATAPLFDGHATALRLAFAGAALGVLRLATAGRATGSRDRWAWLAVASLVLAASALDVPALGLPALVVGGAFAGHWCSGRRVSRNTGTAATVLVLAGLLSASAWELAYRFELRRLLARELPQQVRLPDDATLSQLGGLVDDYLESTDLTALAPRSPSRLLPRDLAYALWRLSPLARGDALSALRVLPARGQPIVFSYGLPISEAGELDRRPERWRDLPVPMGRWPMVEGAQPLHAAGVQWGVVEYWALPLPGFRLGRWGGQGVVAGLLRGGPRSGAETAGLPSDVQLAMFDDRGRVLISPWEEPPSLPSPDDAGGIRLLPTPDGSAWVSSSSAGAEITVLYLPFLPPRRGLERVGGHALGVLLPAGMLALLGALVGLPRVAFRHLLWQSVRSYSKRLLVVFTLLLLLPLLIFNLVLVSTLAERLREQQRAAGEASLHSAQHVLSEYVATLEPGFGLDTTVDDELMDWLSQVVRHELNVYWGSSLYASSKRELFTAHLLPERIPGEVYSRLVLRGGALGSRLNHAGEASYVELYVPLEVPGSGAEGRLFLSMPLLAQQEEIAAEIETLRRQALLVTIALFFVLVAVGSRLARNFTRPLAELVEGTRRIAAGASSVGLAPSELELAALVEAVDEMAARIAEGRAHLLQEKRLVDTVVESITSAVVSVDPAGRVMMHNRVAAELLGVEVGLALLESLAQDARRQPVVAFVSAATDHLAETTVRFKSADDEEREWRLLWVPIAGAGALAALLVVEDATEVLRAQRLSAWAEMARIIAHEIKNPLTPIRLSTEHLQEVYRRDPKQLDSVFERCTANILKQVEELRSIAAEFSIYSYIPRLDRQPGDLVAAMKELLEGYLAAPPPGVTVQFRACEETLPGRFDAKLLSRAVRNLLENALRVSGGSGEVELSLCRSGDMALLQVGDRGPGVPERLVSRIFDPYFSTHDAGTGLGLPIARRIAEEHGGTARAANRPGGGLEVTITIPLS